MKIRKAKIKDIPQIAKLFHELLVYHIRFDETYKFKPDIEEIMSRVYKKIIYSRTSTMLVAEINRKIVGYVKGKIIRRPKVYKVEYNGWMEGAVSQKYRRRGIGQKLTKELIKWFKQKGVNWVELEVDCKNELGISAWRKFGFKDFQLRMKKKI